MYTRTRNLFMPKKPSRHRSLCDRGAKGDGRAGADVRVLQAVRGGGDAEAVDTGGGQGLRAGTGGVPGGHARPVVRHRSAAGRAEHRRGVGAVPGAGGGLPHDRAGDGRGAGLLG